MRSFFYVCKIHKMPYKFILLLHGAKGYIKSPHPNPPPKGEGTNNSIAEKFFMSDIFFI